MAHGTPDWGVTAGAVTTYQLTDLAELAVRLGSPVSFDRRGDVLFLEDFESGLAKWQRGTGGTGASVDLSTNRARRGTFSARLTAGSDGAKVADISHYEPFPVLGNFGAEFSFVRESNFASLEQTVIVDDGVSRTIWQLKLVRSTLELQYFSSAGAYVTFATLGALFTDQLSFDNWKLVIDAVNKKYVRMSFNRQTFSLAGISPLVIIAAVANEFSQKVRLTGRSGFNDRIHVEAVVMTQNEPA